MEWSCSPSYCRTWTCGCVWLKMMLVAKHQRFGNGLPGRTVPGLLSCVSFTTANAAGSILGGAGKACTKFQLQDQVLRWRPNSRKVIKQCPPPQTRRPSRQLYSDPAIMVMKKSKKIPKQRQAGLSGEYCITCKANEAHGLPINLSKKRDFLQRAENYIADENLEVLVNNKEELE